MKEKVGIVGLGRMGMPAAKVMLRSGYDLIGFDIRPEAMQELAEHGGTRAESYREVAEKSHFVIVFVLDDPQVIEVVTGNNGLLTGIGGGSTIICMSTINRGNLESIAGQCAEKGVAFVDCPCTGGPMGIEQGTLTMIAAAPGERIEKCRPILEKMGNIVHVGETPGMGQAVKHCNQLLVATTHAAIMEIFLMAKKGGLDPAKVCEVLGGGIAGSNYFRLTAKSLLEGTPHPGGLGQLAKDIHIVVNSGRSLNLPLLVATSADQYFWAAESLGLKNSEASDLIKAVVRFSEPDAE